MLVAGVDSSTQSTKVLLCRAEDGAVVGQAAAPHPDGTECDPERWWRGVGR
jgi:xylulokinase